MVGVKTPLDSATLRRACDIADRVLGNVNGDQLEAATPCSEWTVRDLMQHMVTATDFFADVAEHGTAPADGNQPEYPPEEITPAFRRHAQRLMTAFEREGAMHRGMRLPTGPATGELAIQVAIGELVVHSWDLATATNQACGGDDIADALLLSDFIALAADVRDDANHPFAPIVKYSVDDPPMDQLVSFLGRRPRFDAGASS